jgi:hypothetical protein
MGALNFPQHMLDYLVKEASHESIIGFFFMFL